jgi:hypothetical protein
LPAGGAADAELTGEGITGGGAGDTALGCGALFALAAGPAVFVVATGACATSAAGVCDEQLHVAPAAARMDVILRAIPDHRCMRQA